MSLPKKLFIKIVLVIFFTLLVAKEPVRLTTT